MFEVIPFSGTAARTSTALTSSLNPATAGNPLQFMVAVTSSSGFFLTGTVTLSNGSTVLGTATLVCGAATLSFEDSESIGIGTFTLTAQYTPDTAAFAPSSGTLSQTVNEAGVVLTSGDNTLTGNQTVNGTVTATSLSGNGSGLTSVNAASLGGVPYSNFARLDIDNKFVGSQTFNGIMWVNGIVTASSFVGDGSGLSNIKGTPGSQGPSGPGGATGPTGATGQTGPTGSIGPIGPQGPIGLTGVQGATGQGFNFIGPWQPSTAYNKYDVLTNGGQTYEVTTGFTSTGTFDATNLSLTAAQGANGTNGANGADGAAGATGATGAQGPKGDTGATGPMGSIGPSGPQGPIGLTGAKGAAGSLGPAGPMGPAGAQGPAGIQGPMGIPGPLGATGAQGPAGLSINWRNAWSNSTAYVVNDAVSLNGSSYLAIAASTGAQPNNSPASWNLLASIGATGPAGSTGPQGPQGPFGAPGIQGPTGPSGSSGATGASGPSGSQLWNTFVAIFNFPVTVSTFTPGTKIQVTRIQAQLGTAPISCKVNGVLQISDGTPTGTHTLTINAAANDSGPSTINYAAGMPITVAVSIAAQGCKFPPIAANVLVQYKAQ